MPGAANAAKHGVSGRHKPELPWLYARKSSRIHGAVQAVQAVDGG